MLHVAANDLMVLDLRGLPELWFVDASGNELTGLLVRDPHKLKVLRASRNQLMVLDLGTGPELTELNVSRNALVSLALNAPRLRHLDVQDNQLTELPLAGLPALRTLATGRNRLASLNLAAAPELRSLAASHNYLDALDLTPLKALERAKVARNQLTSLVLGPSPALERLDCHANRLETLELGDVATLQRLHCGGNRLSALDTSGATALCELRASHNQLRSLDLSPNKHLARVEVRHNPLETLVIGESPTLAHLEVDPGPAIHATEVQRRRLAALRDRPAEKDPAKMDRFELHRFAAVYDEPDREAVLHGIVVDTDRCALGTAVMVYWMSSPHYYLRFDERTEVPAYALLGWDLLEAIEERVRDGAYTHDDVFFDPRNDQQTVDVVGRDWTRYGMDPRGRQPPAFMTHARGLPPTER
ncbi:MAG: DUF4274 domain-containing protein [Alphaproteobacteria bacterium]|nr:DUF4274 domain-containing protein [Alphaproteobacteria bacterium]